MFGTHAIPLSLKNEEFSLSIDQEGDLFIYKCEAGKEKKEKIMLVRRGKNTFFTRIKVQ